MARFISALAISALGARLAAAQPAVFVAAQDPRVTVSGRTELDADGVSRSFDWEATAFYINASAAVWINVSSTASGLNRVFTSVLSSGVWYEQSTQWVQPGEQQLLLVAHNLAGPSIVRCFFDLEPAFNGASQTGKYTVHGFALAAGGDAGKPMAAFSRSIEFVGDSISAGYGAYGVGGGCPVMDYTSGNGKTYNRQICEFFGANCSVVAWSGKGMYENCCDSGETMPSYYLQTRGGNAYVSDWDFSRFLPDAICINLGVNDFGHDSGPAWEANFSATYAQFVLNATRRYGRPSMPVFLIQGNMNNGEPLHDALAVAAAAINAAGGNATYLDLRVGPTDGCGNHPGTLGHAAMFEASKATIASVMGWRWTLVPGFVPDGNDCMPPQHGITLGAAQSLCAATPDCRALTFASNVSAPTGNIDTVYLKNVSGVSGADGWFSYVDMSK